MKNYELQICKPHMKCEKDTWCVYMVRCSDGTLYTGITKNLEKRIEAHNSDKDGARYTRSRRPVKLVYSELAGSRSAAAKLEYRLKKLPLAKKKGLVEERGILNVKCRM